MLEQYLAESSESAINIRAVLFTSVNINHRAEPRSFSKAAFSLNQYARNDNIDSIY